MTKTSKVHASLFFACAIWFFCGGCTSTLPKDESIKHLKAFDAESLQLANKMAQTESIKALMALRQLSRLPLPLQSASVTSDSAGSPYFSLDKNKGIYKYYSSDSCTKTVSDSTQGISISFPFTSRKDSLANFVLSEYSEEATAFEMTMPTRAKAKLLVADHIIASLDYSAELQHQMPQKAKLLFNFSGFRLNCKLSSKFHSDYATIYVDYVLTDNESIKLEGTLRSDVHLKQNSLQFSNLEIVTQVFPLVIHFMADDQFTSQEEMAYPAHFNKHSEFYFTDLKGNRLGDVVFVKVPGTDRISLEIRFEDGSVQNLEELLLLAKNILNLKIPDAG